MKHPSLLYTLLLLTTSILVIGSDAGDKSDSEYEMVTNDDATGLPHQLVQTPQSPTLHASPFDDITHATQVAAVVSSVSSSSVQSEEVAKKDGEQDELETETSQLPLLPHPHTGEPTHDSSNVLTLTVTSQTSQPATEVLRETTTEPDQSTPQTPLVRQRSKPSVSDRSLDRTRQPSRTWRFPEDDGHEEDDCCSKLLSCITRHS